MKSDILEDSKIKKNIIYNIFFIILLIAILIISIVFYKRIFKFSLIIGAFSYFLIVIYYVAMVLDIIILGSYLYYCFNYLKHKVEYNKVASLFKKTDIITYISHCIVILMFVLTYMFTPCSVSGDSMLNTYHDKDRLICSNLFYTPKKNDVIVFEYNDNGINELFIKRVIATKGDTLSYSIASEVLYVNNEVVCHNVSLLQYLTIIDSDKVVDYTINEDKLLVLGDNRNVSYDSRYFGLIDEDKVFGRVLFKIFPFGKVTNEILD